MHYKIILRSIVWTDPLGPSGPIEHSLTNLCSRKSVGICLKD
jgi:hypothetical protein